MPKRAKELSALEVSRLKADGVHFVGGVAGLALVVGGAARSWILRYSLGGRRPEMGLGSYPEVGLGEARRKGAEARELVRQGLDPIRSAKAARSANLAAQAQLRTFAECAAGFIADKESEWSNVKHAAQWRSTLATYAYPVIGGLNVADVTTAHLVTILRPIWKTKTETATRVRNRIENVLDWATVADLRTGPNPAKWTGHLEHLLAAPEKVQKVVHHRSMPYGELPAFMERLRKAEGQGARALEFAILCASRSGEVRGATWPEIDDALWIIPADRMKTDREHRVPLTAAALQLLERQPKDGALIFPSTQGKPLSDMTLTAVLRRMDVDAVPHGFRATFKTWATERTTFPREVVEMALAHAVEGKVEGAYQRGDLLEKRRRLMAAWAAYCTAKPSANVTPIREAKR
ncbi:MAG: tyrosine-type recombinase/integrase [Burkholderiales bacterium]|nr:tyrosine-type recombinase/integrase [Burkholderiales bacterium]